MSTSDKVVATGVVVLVAAPAVVFGIEAGAAAAFSNPVATQRVGAGIAEFLAGESTGGAAVTTGIVVTSAKLNAALADSTMQTAQKSISIPVVQRYVNMLIGGSKPPPIKVDGNVIVNGNHRYAAGRIVGEDPPTTPYSLSPSQHSVVQPVQNLKFDPVDHGNY